MTKRNRKPATPKKAGGVGGGEAPAAYNSRLKSIASDLLSLLEVSIKRQDANAILNLVGRSQNIIPALNTVARLVARLEEEGIEASAYPDDDAGTDPMKMTAADCDLMVRYCIRRLSILHNGKVDDERAAVAWEAWISATQLWREHNVSA